MVAPASLRLRFGPFEFDEANARLTRDGEPVALAPKAFDVLGALLRQPGQLVTKDALLDAVWGHRHVSDSVLKTTVSELRGALGDDARSPRYVETASRRGYRFIGAASDTGASAARAPALPPPSVPAAAPGGPPIIGRDAALARLRQSWDEAAAGRRRICCVAGEAGIGKTTLIDTLVSGLGAVAQAHGQCIEQVGAGEPYLPVLEALAALGRRDPELLPLLRRVAPTWLLQMPWLVSSEERDRLRSGLAASTQDRMLREFSELVEEYTADTPLLLVTEDLHWCDDATVRLLDHVARRRPPARLMWIASFRVAELVAEDHPLNGVRHELRARRLCEELTLESFSEAELADYVRWRLPRREIEEAWVQRLHRQTDGLPLFVVNAMDVLDAAPASPAPHAPRAAGPDDWAVPDTLAGVIERQVGRAGAADAELLEAAAACGVEFGVAMLADILERDADAVGLACDELVRRQYWLQPVSPGMRGAEARDTRFAFRHALYRQVLYQRIGAARRAALHRRAAAAIARRRAAGLPDSALALALHHERGLEPLAAMGAYAAAAESALGRFAPAEALRAVDHALALLPRCREDTARQEIELVLMHLRGTALAQSSGVATEDTDAAFRRAAELCELLPPTPRRAWFLTGLCWALVARAQYAECEAVAVRAQEAAERHGDRALLSIACCAQAIVRAQAGRLEEAEPLARRAIELSRDFDAARAPAALVLDPIVTAHGVGAVILAHQGRVATAEAWAATAIARADELGNPVSRGLSRRCSGMVMVRIGRPARAAEVARGILALVEQHGVLQGEGPARCLLGWAEARLGDPAQGHRMIVESHGAYLRRGAWFDATLAMCLAAEAALRAGDAAAALQHIDEGMALVERFGERVHVPDLLLAHAAVARQHGEGALARARTQEALRLAAAMGAVIAQLEAAVGLCELEDAGAADLAALRDARARWPGEPGIELVQRADRLLGD
jgi:DNA-binding winged helix-turn-helix (wHTH) protein/tetratricopeptide (TPR) repeat protein